MNRECGDRVRRHVVLGGWLGAGRVVGLGATRVVAGPTVVDVGGCGRGSSAPRLRTATSPAVTRATSPRENQARASKRSSYLRSAVQVARCRARSSAST